MTVGIDHRQGGKRLDQSNRSSVDDDEDCDAKSLAELTSFGRRETRKSSGGGGSVISLHPHHNFKANKLSSLRMSTSDDEQRWYGRRSSDGHRRHNDHSDNSLLSRNPFVAEIISSTIGGVNIKTVLLCMLGMMLILKLNAPPNPSIHTDAPQSFESVTMTRNTLHATGGVRGKLIRKAGDEEYWQDSLAILDALEEAEAGGVSDGSGGGGGFLTRMDNPPMMQPQVLSSGQQLQQQMGIPQQQQLVDNQHQMTTNAYQQPSTTISLTISGTSMLAHEIESIVHAPEKSMIVINFKTQRECLEPHLIGRMSGPMLAKLVWEEKATYQKDNNVIVGRYDHASLLPGKYFIEILATMCNKLTVHTSNITSICMVDPSRQRLTEDGVFIIVLPSSSSIVTGDENTRTIIGHWYDASPAGINYTYLPLYTRFQPQNCMDNNISSARCSEALDTERFEPYKFNFTKQIDIKKLLEGRQEKICFIGASHSRHLIAHSKALETILNDDSSLPIKWTGPTNDNNKLHAKGEVTASLGEILQFDFVEAKFALNLTDKNKIYEIINKNCTKIIIGTGQWDAGWPGNDVTPFNMYEETLKTVMSLVIQLLPPSMHVFYRSVHYNTIGDKTGHCPPTDWRSPNVIDVYNEITKRACKASGMRFIDTSDIMGIMWDRAFDLSHYQDISSDVEMIYFVRMVLSTIYDQ